jgi:hypothetical protein
MRNQMMVYVLLDIVVVFFFGSEGDPQDENWADEEVFQGMKNEEYRFLSGVSRS